MAKIKKTEENQLKVAKDLVAEYPNLWDVLGEEEQQNALDFADDYRSFLDLSKTEREFVKLGVSVLEELGFQEFTTKKTLKWGDKVYRTVHGKGLCIAVVGKEAAVDGFNLLGAHIDSPRIDLKPSPLYESNEITYFKTHYYGGVKKYQWVALPLSLHGVIYKKDGTCLEVNIGENEEDPVFYISDLLPHLAQNQMQKTGDKLVEGEQLNLIVGGKPLADKEVSKRFKLGLLSLLQEKYGLEEKDFVTSELEVVPALKAKMVGFDKSYIAAYGQDDRVCAYTALRAILDITKPQRTTVCFLYDKEEIGSEGNTGAQSRIYENFQAELFAKLHGQYDELAFRKSLENSFMLSTDVSNGYDPSFPEVSDPLNSTYLGRGMGILKYTGSRGKAGASDAHAEFLNKVVRILDEAKVAWQIGELGKVDQGGGGTICKYAASMGMQVLDCGIPVLSMHAPYELTHTLDVYNLYLAYKAFLNNCLNK